MRASFGAGKVRQDRFPAAPVRVFVVASGRGSSEEHPAGLRRTARPGGASLPRRRPLYSADPAWRRRDRRRLGLSDIFISYAREDRERVRPLAEALETTGWSVFWDYQIPLGSNWHRHIGRELEQASCVVVAWSATSVESDWVREEAAEARDREVLIPVRLDETRPPLGFRSQHSLKLAGWSGEKGAPLFQELVRGLERLLGPRPRGQPRASRGAAEKSGGAARPRRRVADASPRERLLAARSRVSGEADMAAYAERLAEALEDPAIAAQARSRYETICSTIDELRHGGGHSGSGDEIRDERRAIEKLTSDAWRRLRGEDGASYGALQNYVHEGGLGEWIEYSWEAGDDGLKIKCWSEEWPEKVLLAMRFREAVSEVTARVNTGRARALKPGKDVLLEMDRQLDSGDTLYVEARGGGASVALGWNYWPDEPS